MKKIIHVNQHIIKKNTKDGENNPVLTCKTYKGNQYAHEIQINGPCKIIYNPNNPLSCGARVYIEVLDGVDVVLINKEQNIPTYQYKCSSCKKKYDAFLTFKEYDDGIVPPCTKCNSSAVSRIYEGVPYFAIKGNINTVGQLAEKNAKKIGTNKIKEYQHQQKEKEVKKKGPWYGKLDKDKFKTIQKTTDKKRKKEIIQKYIMEGT